MNWTKDSVLASRDSDTIRFVRIKKEEDNIDAEVRYLYADKHAFSMPHTYILTYNIYTR